MRRNAKLIALATLALATALGPAFGSVTTANLNGAGWDYDWGTLGLDTAGYKTALDGGTHLVWDDFANFSAGDGVSGIAIDDYALAPDADPHIPSGGELWDVEALAYCNPNDGTNKYHFLAIISTPENIVDWHGDKIAIGDLAIGAETTGTGNGRSFTADLGVKLAGSNKNSVTKDAKFGWSIVQSDDSRDPYTTSFLTDVSSLNGYKPNTVVDPASGGYDWASNFVGNSSPSAKTANVTWHEVFSNGDGPKGKDALGNPWKTYAVEITVDKADWAAPEGMFTVSLATSCLNDGLRLTTEGGGKVPELPPAMLIGALPALSALWRLRRGK